MASKLFLDTNILLDFLDKSRKNHADAVKLLSQGETGHYTLYTSESVINTTIYIISKLIPRATIVSIVEALLVFVQILPANNTIVLKALQMAKNDLEDAVLYQIALAHQMDFFITNDLKDLKRLQVKELPVINAKDLLLLQ
jgi:predicted nucleic acid-binding protein